MGETKKEIKNSKPLLAISDGDTTFDDTSCCSILPMPDSIKQIILLVFKHYQIITFEI